MNSEGHDANDAPGLLPIATFVIWMTCFGVGYAGLRIPYPRPRATLPQDFQARLVTVELPKAEAPPPPDIAPPEPVSSAAVLTMPTPQAPPPVAVPDAPTVTAVVAPSAAVAFALPVQGLTRIVDVNEAAHGKSMQGAAAGGSGSGQGAAVPPAPATKPLPQIAALPAVTRLTFGQGEGRQPPPDYPREAVSGGQQGTVTVRFSVDETGSVTAAQIVPGGGARWPLLNRSALQAVRDSWHFPPGPARIYEVPIQFELPQ